MEPAQRPNKLLRLQRRLRGWSQEDVVAALRRVAVSLGEPDPGVDATMVSRWERGTRRPRPRYVRLLSRLFELPPEQLGIVEGGELAAAPPPPPPVSARPGDDAGRREFFMRLASLFSVAALPPMFQPAGSEPWERLSHAIGRLGGVDRETVADLERMTVRLENLEPTQVGSLALIGPVTGHLDVISLLLHGSPSPDVRSRLCSIAAETAGFAGWLHWNIGDAGRAANYFRMALRAAEEARDLALGIALVGSVACLRSPLERIERLQGTPNFALAHSTPSNRVWLAAKEADAYAAMGRSEECRRALDRAEMLLRQVEDEGEERRPRYMVVDANWLAGEQGASLAKLGRTAEARELLLPVLAALGPTSERDRTWLTFALASTYLKDGETSEAARLGRLALAGARRINLEPVLGLVRGLRDELKTIDLSPAVQDLDGDVNELTAG